MFLNRLSAHDTALLYLIVGMLGVVPLVLITPPFQVPDEHQHFFRAYQLSELGWRGEVVLGKAGGFLPSSLAELAERFLGSRDLHSWWNVNSSPLAEIFAATSIPLEPTRRGFIAFSAAAIYSPLPYLPQAAAIAIGREMGLGPLGLFYSARLANGLVALLIVASALRVLPIGNFMLLVAGLLPMVLYLFASLSPDAATIASAFLFTAIAMRARFRGFWTWKDIILASLLGCVFCSLKPVYLPLLVMGLPALFQGGSAANVIKAHVAIIAIVLCVTLLWFVYSSHAAVEIRNGVDPSEQLGGILRHPAAFANMVLDTVWLNAWYWVLGMIGILGWITIRLPGIMYFMPIAAGLACLPLSNPEAPRICLLETAWQALLLCASSLLIIVALYLLWTPVGSGAIEGVQGRYFLPLAGLAAVTLSATIPPTSLNKSWLVLGVLLVVVTEALLTTIVVANTYQVYCDCRYFKGILINQVD